MKKSEKKKKKKLKKELEKTQAEPQAATPAVSAASDDTKRLNRIAGQVEGIRNMLGEGRDVSAILNQCKAVHSALRAFESSLLATQLDRAMSDLEKMDKKKSRQQRIGELLELYKQVA